MIGISNIAELPNLTDRLAGWSDDQVEARLADPAFGEFRRRTLARRIANGMSIEDAISLTQAETRVRARASLTVGIDDALAARMLVNKFGMMFGEEPRVVLVGLA
jgi:methylaspartate ammonia-lyase